MTGVVFNIMRYAVNDGPGIRTTVFLKGCPLHCLWCHNPESLSPRQEVVVRVDRCIRCGTCVDICEHGASQEVDGAFVLLRERCQRCGRCVEACVAGAREFVGREMTTEEVLSEVERDRVFYDQSGGGVTFSGGEPLLQHAFLLSLLLGCRQRSLHTAVDTSGYAAPTVLERVAAVTDLFLYDLKLYDDERHRRFTGVSNHLIRENLRRLVRWGCRVIVRMPLIPGVNDDAENVSAIGQFVASLGGVTAIHVLPYHTTGIAKYERLGRPFRLGRVVPPTPAQVDDVVRLFRPHVAAVSVGG